MDKILLDLFFERVSGGVSMCQWGRSFLTLNHVKQGTCQWGRSFLTLNRVKQGTSPLTSPLTHQNKNVTKM